MIKTIKLFSCNLDNKKGPEIVSGPFLLCFCFTCRTLEGREMRQQRTRLQVPK